MKSFIKFIIYITISGLVSYNIKAQERIVNFDDYQIHIKVTGKGKPVVIIEAGLGSGFDAYDTLHKTISPIARVLSYDRPGLGKSSTSPYPRTLPNYIAELRLLLQKEMIDPPYILVGHSLWMFTWLKGREKDGLIRNQFHH